MKKRIIYVLIGVFLSLSSYSQIEVGGTCGLGVTNNYLSVDVAPEISYTFIEHLKLGVSPFLLYNKDLASTYWTLMYGGRVFGEYVFDCNIIVHGEYEYAQISDSEEYKTNISALPIGVGYTTQVSEKMIAYALVLYDVLYDEMWAVRTNPSFRLGVRYKF